MHNGQVDSLNIVDEKCYHKYKMLGFITCEFGLLWLWYSDGRVVGCSHAYNGQVGYFKIVVDKCHYKCAMPDFIICGCGLLWLWYFALRVVG